MCKVSVLNPIIEPREGVMSTASQPRRARAPKPDVPRPAVAVPTVVMAVVLVALWALATWAAVATGTPWFVTVPVHAFVGFAMFTVLHDAAHRGTGRVRWVSEVLGRVSMLFVVPYGSFHMFRWLHLAHHGHVNEGTDADPDDWVTHGPSWQLPLRWPLIDVRYLTFYAARLRRRPAKEIAETAGLFVVFWFAIAWLFATGRAEVALVVFLVPQRITLTVLAWWFDWLPHHDLAATNRDDRYQTTRNIVGMEWLLTPLLFSQNYHLLHHLHPIVPFYRYIQAWRQDESGHLAQGPALATPTLRRLSVEEYATQRRISLGDADPAQGGSGYDTARTTRSTPAEPDGDPSGDRGPIPSPSTGGGHRVTAG